jgi:hypothetical protein
MPSHVTTDGSCDSETLEMSNMLKSGVGPVLMSALEVAQEAGENATPITVTHHPLSPDADTQNHILANSDKVCFVKMNCVTKMYKSCVLLNVSYFTAELHWYLIIIEW